MLLLVGLGNPGPRYAWNRHNVGFMALDCITQEYGFSDYRPKFHGLLADGRIDGERVLALKPSTHMNRSGISVGETARFHKIPPEDVVVIYDELDLAPGKIRVKTGGGNAGHNGLRSIDSHFGKGYRRLRIGIGHPGDKNAVQSYVLRDFSKEDQVWVDALLPAIATATPHLVRGDDAGFMNRVAVILNPRPERPKKEKEDEDDQ